MPRDLKTMTLGELMESPVREVRGHAYMLMHELTLRYFEDQAKDIILTDERCTRVERETFMALS